MDLVVVCFRAAKSAGRRKLFKKIILFTEVLPAVSLRPQAVKIGVSGACPDAGRCSRLPGKLPVFEVFQCLLQKPVLCDESFKGSLRFRLGYNGNDFVLRVGSFHISTEMFSIICFTVIEIMAAALRPPGSWSSRFPSGAHKRVRCWAAQARSIIAERVRRRFFAIISTALITSSDK